MSLLRSAKTVAAAVLLGLLGAADAVSDLRTTVTLEALLSGLSDPPGAVLLGIGGSARLDLTATGNRDVRGRLSLRADAAPAPGRPADRLTD